MFLCSVQACVCTLPKTARFCSATAKLQVSRDSMHNTRILTLTQLNGMQPSLTVLFIPVLFLLCRVKMSLEHRLNLPQVVPP